MAYKSLTAYLGEVGRTLSNVEGFACSTASTITLEVAKPSGGTASFSPTISDTLTTSWYYNTTASDLDEAGIWIAQLKVVTTTSLIRYGTEFSLLVESPISGGATVGGGGWQGGGLSEDDIQDMIDVSVGTGSTLSVQDIQDMIDVAISANCTSCTGGGGALGAWTDITYSADDFEGDGICVFTPSSDVDPWHYKLLDADTMILQLAQWGNIVNSGTATFCGFFRVKMPLGMRPKKYGTFPGIIELPSGTPAQWGSGYYPVAIYADPDNDGWLDIYADQSLWATTASADAGVFPIDTHGFNMFFDITMLVEDIP